MADDLPLAKRERLTKWQFATLYLQQQGKCAVCGCKLERGKVRDEHLHALHLGGGNELTNRALWCLGCTKPKDKSDKARIAKVKRLRGETCTGPRQKIPQRAGPSALSKQHSGYRKPTWAKRGWK